MSRNFILAFLTLVAAGVGAFWYFGQPVPQGGPLVEVAVPALSVAESQGEAKYTALCAKCHGANGAGQAGIAPPFVHPVYEPGHHADAAFLAAALTGVRAHHWPFGDMPPVEGATEQDVRQIVAYVRALQRANGIR